MTDAQYLPDVLPASMMSWRPVLDSMRRERWLRDYGSRIADGQSAVYLDMPEHMTVVAQSRPVVWLADWSSQHGRASDAHWPASSHTASRPDLILDSIKSERIFRDRTDRVNSKAGH